MKQITAYIIENKSKGWNCKLEIAEQVLQQFMPGTPKKYNISSACARNIVNNFDDWFKVWHENKKNIDDFELYTYDDDFKYGDKVIVDKKLYDHIENLQEKSHKCYDHNDLMYKHGITMYSCGSGRYYGEALVYDYQDNIFVVKPKE